MEIQWHGMHSFSKNWGDEAIFIYATSSFTTYEHDSAICESKKKNQVVLGIIVIRRRERLRNLPIISHATMTDRGCEFYTTRRQCNTAWLISPIARIFKSETDLIISPHPRKWKSYSINVDSTSGPKKSIFSTFSLCMFMSIVTSMKKSTNVYHYNLHRTPPSSLTDPRCQNTHPTSKTRPSACQTHGIVGSSVENSLHLHFVQNSYEVISICLENWVGLTLLNS